MAPEARGEDLLYVSDSGGVHIFSYPKGTPVGEIRGFMSPEGLCSDRAGNVFVTDSIVGRVWEFAHGSTKPIRYFTDIYVDFHPSDCSVDPTTRNLAVASQDAGFVVIFPNEKNNPEVYYDAYAIMFHCAYDAHGNLYTDLVTHQHRQYIGVLLKGSSGFTNYLLDRRAGIPGGLQFDGQHIVANDLDTNILHQLHFFSSKAIVIGSTPLNGAKQIEQFWIHKRRVVGPDLYGNVYYWRYPVGGSLVHSIGGFTDPVGSAISVSL
jgi:DNA-binding beta-propeller fold protein YncE